MASLSARKSAIIDGEKPTTLPIASLIEMYLYQLWWSLLYQYASNLYSS